MSKWLHAVVTFAGLAGVALVNVLVAGCKSLGSVSFRAGGETIDVVPAKGGGTTIDVQGPRFGGSVTLPTGEAPPVAPPAEGGGH